MLLFNFPKPFSFCFPRGLHRRQAHTPPQRRDRGTSQKKALRATPITSLARGVS